MGYDSCRSRHKNYRQSIRSQRKKGRATWYAVGRISFNRSNNNVADICISLAGTTEDPYAHKLLGARIVSDFQISLHLYHSAFTPSLTKVPGIGTIPPFRYNILALPSSVGTVYLYRCIDTTARGQNNAAVYIRNIDPRRITPLRISTLPR